MQRFGYQTNLAVVLDTVETARNPVATALSLTVLHKRLPGAEFMSLLHDSCMSYCPSFLGHHEHDKGPTYVSEWGHLKG